MSSPMYCFSQLNCKGKGWMACSGLGETCHIQTGAESKKETLILAGTSLKKNPLISKAPVNCSILLSALWDQETGAQSSLGLL